MSSKKSHSSSTSRIVAKQGKHSFSSVGNRKNNSNNVTSDVRYKNNNNSYRKKNSTTKNNIIETIYSYFCHYAEPPVTLGKCFNKLNLKSIENYEDMKNSIYWTRAKEQRVGTTARFKQLLSHVKVNNSKLNFFPGMYEVCTKAKLGTLFRLNAVLFDNKSNTRQQSLYNFLPTQFIFPQDYKLFRRVLEANETLPANERKVYIYKPNAGNSGKGIMLIRGVDDMESFEQDNVFKNIVFKGVVQEYLENPFTFPDKLKFDFRLYVYVDSLYPYNVYICREGLCRFCTVPYEKPTSENADNDRMHLTNFAVNKKKEKEETIVDNDSNDAGNTSYSSSGLLLNNLLLFDDSSTAENSEEGIKKTLTHVLADLRSLGYNVDKLWKKIIKLVEYTCATMHPHLNYELYKKYDYNNLLTGDSNKHNIGPSSKNPCFQIIGFDVMLTKKSEDSNELLPWLLEVNAHPSLKTAYNSKEDGVHISTISPIDAEIKEKVIEGALSLACNSTKPAMYYEKIQFDTKSEFLIHSGLKLGRIFDHLCTFRNAETIDRLTFYRLCMSVKSFESNKKYGLKRVMSKNQRESITSSEIQSACEKILGGIKTTHYPRNTKLIDFDVFCELFFLVFSFENGFEQNTLQSTIDTLIQSMEENNLTLEKKLKTIDDVTFNRKKENNNKSSKEKKKRKNKKQNHEQISLAHSLFLKTQKEERLLEKQREHDLKQKEIEKKIIRNEEGSKKWEKIKISKKKNRLKKKKQIRKEDEEYQKELEKERRKKEADAWLQERKDRKK